ncbi:hypothetical protein B0H13DRAFT_1904042 [Mycena leptocephala]|nr:hypothetical protein B0H13DRAFT_1904042 [Mycena leptocephala]
MDTGLAPGSASWIWFPSGSHRRKRREGRRARRGEVKGEEEGGARGVVAEAVGAGVRDELSPDTHTQRKARGKVRAGAPKSGYTGERARDTRPQAWRLALGAAIRYALGHAVPCKIRAPKRRCVCARIGVEVGYGDFLGEKRDERNSRRRQQGRDRRADRRAGGRPRKEHMGAEETREEGRSRDVNMGVSSRRAMSGTRAAGYQPSPDARRGATPKRRQARLSERGTRARYASVAMGLAPRRNENERCRRREGQGEGRERLTKEEEGADEERG